VDHRKTISSFFFRTLITHIRIILSLLRTTAKHDQGGQRYLGDG
jgi:hypothetical protein